MSRPEQTGAMELSGPAWSATVLQRPPLIAPARQFTFPFAVAGEEDALARGALWLQVRSAGAADAASGTWLAQCALGFAGAGVAHGLWPLPDGNLLACAGGYAYAIDPAVPEKTKLLPPRPAVAVIALEQRTALVTHHALVIREAEGDVWTTPRLSWEGLTITEANEEAIRGLGWNLMDDLEVGFAIDLVNRTAAGGGYSTPGAPSGTERR